MTQTVSRSGFGLLHDGSIDSISRFVSEEAFDVANDQEVADLVALLLAFSGSDFGLPGFLEPPGPANLDSHAAMGQQITLQGGSATTALLQTFLDLAATGAVDLIAKTAIDQVPRGWVLQNAGQFKSDLAAETPVNAQTILQSMPESAYLTFTLVPTGSGTRLGIDRDADGLPDQDEAKDYLPEIAGIQNPFHASSSDVSGDNYLNEPDGIPDGENDYDGDGLNNQLELIAGSNPADGLEQHLGPRMVIGLQITSGRITLQWQAPLQGDYQIEYSLGNGIWLRPENSEFKAVAAGTELAWEQDIQTSNSMRFYRIILWATP